VLGNAGGTNKPGKPGLGDMNWGTPLGTAIRGDQQADATDFGLVFVQESFTRRRLARKISPLRPVPSDLRAGVLGGSDSEPLVKNSTELTDWDGLNTCFPQETSSLIDQIDQKNFVNMSILQTMVRLI
jgi:hypothetical protein